MRHRVNSTVALVMVLVMTACSGASAPAGDDASASAEAVARPDTAPSAASNEAHSPSAGRGLTELPLDPSWLSAFQSVVGPVDTVRSYGSRDDVTTVSEALHRELTSSGYSFAISGASQPIELSHWTRGLYTKPGFPDVAIEVTRIPTTEDDWSTIYDLLPSLPAGVQQEFKASRQWYQSHAFVVSGEGLANVLNGGPGSEASAAATVEAPIDGAGALLLSCGTRAVTFQRLDPVTGAVLAVKQVPTTYPAAKAAGQFVSVPLDCRSDPLLNIETRQRFNRDLSKVVVQESPSLKRNERHVGFVDIATGQYTDLTEMSKPTGFSATAPYDDNPFFDKQTGDVWWTRDATILMRYREADQSISQVYQAPERWTFRPWHVNSGDLFLGTEAGIISPDGNYRAYGRCPLSSELCRDTRNGDIYILPADWNQQSVGRNSMQVIDVTEMDSSTGLLIYAWLNNRQLLTAAPANFQIITFEPGVTGNRTVPPGGLVLPANNRLNYNAVPSPDGSQIMFLSRDSNRVTGLYVSSVTGGEPKELKGPGNVSLILGWQ